MTDGGCYRYSTARKGNGKSKAGGTLTRINLAYIGGGSTRAPGTMASFITQGENFGGSDLVHQGHHRYRHGRALVAER